MQADFLDAHARHWEDAEYLFRARRWANADYLYGMAAECGLKRLMLRFSMAINPVTGSPADNKDLKHVNNMWARYESYRSGKVEGIDYALPVANPFANWHISDRYAHQSNFDQARAQDHRTGARMVRNLIAKAQCEGML